MKTRGEHLIFKIDLGTCENSLPNKMALSCFSKRNDQ